MKTRLVALSLLFVTSSWLPLRAANEIGFIEKFAIASDREAVLKELITGTEEYYFYHALHFQNTGKQKELDEVIKQWSKRTPGSLLLREIRNRNALLNYEKDPAATVAYLKSVVGVSFNHFQQTLNPKPDLPVKVDDKWIAQDLFVKEALRDPNQLGGVTNDGLKLLLEIKAPLSGPQRRQLLSRVDRPDLPGLVDLILVELGTPESHGFGEFPIHANLLIDQLDSLRKAKPELLTSGSFVHTWLQKLRPNADVNLLTNTKAREAWLDAAYAFVKPLAPGFNSIKAQILFARLNHDLKLGKLNSGRFLEYLKLPRNFSYVSPRYREKQEVFSHPADLNADLRNVIGTPPVGEDESLVRAYLLALLVDAVDASAFAPYIEEGYLNQLLAEAKLTAGKGDAEKWFSLLSPTAVQQLRERVDLDFDRTNPEVIEPSQSVELNVHVKNVPHLTTSIYEINTLNYYRSSGQQVGTDLNLDGLVANVLQNADFAEAPILRVNRTLKFPQLDGKRGVWMIDLIGNGKSSRALIRKGQLHHVTRPSSAGTAITILDETLKPIPKAKALVGGQEFTADERGEIMLPFSNQPGNQSVILTDGQGFAQLQQIDLQGENYQLTAGFHVAHESLVSGRKATLAIRPNLVVNGAPVDLKLLEEVKLTITSTNQDGINSTTTKPEFKLKENKEATFEFTVPERLTQLNFNLEAKVKSLITGEKVALTATGAQAVNSSDRSDLTADMYFSRTGSTYVVQVLGRSGEPRPEQVCAVRFFKNEFSEALYRDLKTDAAGAITLGALPGIDRVLVESTGLVSRTLTLPKDTFSSPENLHVAVGEKIVLPWMGSGNELDASFISLLETRQGGFIRNVLSDKTATVSGGYLILQNLEAGDYSLKYGLPVRAATIRVTQGKDAGSYLIGDGRMLERNAYQSLQVRSVAKGADSLVITLGGNGADARVHVLVSHFVPDFNAFAALGNPPELQPLVGAPSSLKSLYLSGRTLGEEYRYVLDRRGEKKFPGSLLPRPGLLLNPWAVRETETSLDEAREGEKFAKLSDGQAAVAERAKKRPEMQKLDESLKRAAEQISSVNFLANTGATLFNLVPDKDGKVTIKLADLGDKQFVRILAVDGTSAVQRDISLDDAGTEIRNLALRNGLDPKGHFTRQNQVTILEKDVPYTIKDAATTQFELSDDLGKVFSLFGTLSNNPTLREFSFLLEWPTFDAAKKLELYSKYACHELTFFVQRKDPAFFKTVVLPYLANKRDKTFLDHYSLSNDLKSFLQPWSYGRLNTVERILLAQRHPEQAVVTARDIRELWEIKPVDQVMAWQRFDTALDDGRLEGGAAVRFGVVLDGLSVAEEKSVVRLAAAEKPANGPVAASAPAPPPPSAPMGAAAGRGGAKDKAEKANGRKSGAVVTNGALGVESELVAESDDAVSALKELKGRANRFAEQRDQAGKDMELRQKEMKAFYRQQPRTQEWAENNYYHVIIQQQLADLVKVNAFWRDYAAWNGKGGFLSEHITEAAGNFTEMMFALAVLDLPFPSQAKAPKAEQKDLALTLTPASRALLFHREIKPAEIDKDAPRLLVSQNFYRNGDRYVQKGNEKLDKFVTEEFLTGVIYGCQIVVTNPTSSTQKLELLLQIPQGALPVMGSKATDNVSVSLESYRTHTQDYFFYFPRVGKFDQHPVHVSKSEKVVAFAEPFQFNVVNELTKLDTASWEYVSQFGKPEEVLAFLEQNNLHRLDLVKMAWRLKDAGFFAKAIALLNQRHVFNSTVWSYGLMHQSLTEIGQFLQHVDGFINECGPTLTSKLIAIDPVARYSYEHLEYSPLVNARAHTLGTTRSILNDRLNGQYHSFLNVLAHQATLSEEDELGLVYYLLLQDRVEEALETFAKVDATKVAEKLQLDYLKAVLACYQSDTATARQIAALHEKEPVNRWKEKFAEVLAQLDEIDGKKPAGAKEDDRDQRQNQLAANEPSLDFTVESREIKMKYRNIKEATVNYYAMDLEFLFSTAPFVSSDTSRFSMIQPTKTERVVLAADKDAHTLALPKEFHSSNVLVEITANGKSTARAYYANELNVVVSEGQGRIQVLHVGDNRPLAKTYVKVFAEINGQPKFYKDGYTDLRGKFDYLSLSTKELDQATRFSILVLNEQHGAAVKEVKPPQQ